MLASALLGAVLAGPAAADAPAPVPRRVVSLNVCTDSLLLELAPDERIASVTHLSRDPGLSYHAARARRLPVNHGLAEEVLPLAPDLVLAGRYTTTATTALLSRLGYPVLRLDPVESLSELRSALRAVGAALGLADRAERLIAAMDRRLAAVPPPPPGRARLRAAVFRPNGFTAGARSWLGELLSAAGLDNVAAGLGMERDGFLPLERLVAADPDLLLLGERDPEHPSLAHALLRHPALRALAARPRGGRRPREVELPTRLWTCAGTHAARAVERLAAARDALLAASASR